MTRMPWQRLLPLIRYKRLIAIAALSVVVAVAFHFVLPCIKQERLLATLKTSGYSIHIGPPGSSTIQRGSISIETHSWIVSMSSRMPWLAWLFGVPDAACSNSFPSGDSSNRLRTDTIQSLKRLAMLDARVLWLPDSVADDSVALIIAKGKKIESIHMENTVITNLGATALLSVSNLRTLSMSGTRIDNSLSMPRHTTNNSVSIYLRGTRVADEAVSRVLDAFQVYGLDVADTLISDKCSNRISTEPTLAELSIGGNYLTNETVVEISKSLSIRKLFLRALPVDERGIYALASALTLEQITILNGGEMQIKGAETRKELEALANSKSLTKVVVRTDDGVRAYERDSWGKFADQE